MDEKEHSKPSAAVREDVIGFDETMASMRRMFFDLPRFLLLDVL
jgi:hypothetical protein